MKTFSTPASSNVASVSHDGSTLTVVFKNGGAYSYARVPESVFEALKSAPSVGAYLARHVKPNYPATRGTAPQTEIKS
jgi:hypothetical protein